MEPSFPLFISTSKRPLATPYQAQEWLGRIAGDHTSVLSPDTGLVAAALYAAQDKRVVRAYKWSTRSRITAMLPAAFARTLLAKRLNDLPKESLSRIWNDHAMSYQVCRFAADFHPHEFALEMNDWAQFFQYVNIAAGLLAALESLQARPSPSTMNVERLKRALTDLAKIRVKNQLTAHMAPSGQTAS